MSYVKPSALTANLPYAFAYGTIKRLIKRIVLYVQIRRVGFYVAEHTKIS